MMSNKNFEKWSGRNKARFHNEGGRVQNELKKPSPFTNPRTGKNYQSSNFRPDAGLNHGKFRPKDTVKTPLEGWTAAINKKSRLQGARNSDTVKNSVGQNNLVYANDGDDEDDINGRLVISFTPVSEEHAPMHSNSAIDMDAESVDRRHANVTRKSTKQKANSLPQREVTCSTPSLNGSFNWRQKCEILEKQLNEEIDRHIDAERRCAELEDRNAQLEKTVATLKENWPKVFDAALSVPNGDASEELSLVSPQKPVSPWPHRTDVVPKMGRNSSHGNDNASADPRTRTKSIPANGSGPCFAGVASHQIPFAQYPAPTSADQPPMFCGPLPDFSRPPPPVPLMMLHFPQPPAEPKKRGRTTLLRDPAFRTKRNRPSRWDN